MAAWTLLSSKLVESARMILTTYQILGSVYVVSVFIEHQRTVSRAAAPTPATPRPTSSTVIELAPVLIAEPTMKQRIPICIAQYRPNMSAMEAKTGKKTVLVST